MVQGCNANTVVPCADSSHPSLACSPSNLTPPVLIINERQGA
jgi:hypothetical protein